MLGAILRMIIPEGMTLEYCNFTTGEHVLENDQELADFKIGNWIPGTQLHVNPQFALDIMVDESPRVRLEEMARAMLLSVQIVREIFESHFGFKR